MSGSFNEYIKQLNTKKCINDEWGHFYFMNIDKESEKNKYNLTIANIISKIINTFIKNDNYEDNNFKMKKSLSSRNMLNIDKIPELDNKIDINRINKIYDYYEPLSTICLFGIIYVIFI
jgi:hypothetical protein